MMKWAPVSIPLATRWSGEIDPSAPFPEYPRPQLVRSEWNNLNGLWEYVVQGRELDQPRFDSDARILVPFAPESALSGVGRPPIEESERLWYRREFEVPNAWAGRRVLINFGAVDFEAEVRINAARVGGHVGGYTPFSLDITDELVPGTNEIVVAVLDDSARERGKQSGDLRSSGIWQPVWLEPVGDRSIERLVITTSASDGSITVGADVRRSGGHLTLRVQATAQGEPAGSGSSRAAESVTLQVPGARLWSPDDPFLYDLRVQLLEGDTVVDDVTSYAGIRTVSVELAADGHRRLFLNGEPRFQSGVLDHAFWPDGLWTPPTDDALIFDVETARRLGFDMIRKHVKVESARWYHHCDRLGMLVWQDMPNGGEYIHAPGRELFAEYYTPPIDPAALWADPGFQDLHRDKMWRFTDAPGGGRDIDGREDFERQLREMIEALRNAPSVVAWVVFNEGWGQFDTERISREVSELDPTRILDAASGWHDHGNGDLVSFHDYSKEVPLPHPERLNGRALVLSEYGGDTWSVPGHSGPEAYGYRIYESREELSAGYEEMLRMLGRLKSQGLAGAVLTELADMAGEQNGLITIDREVIKVDEEKSAALHRALRADRAP